MRLGTQFKEFQASTYRAKLRRQENGCVEIFGHGAMGLGVAHAHDRMVQMLISRVVAEGRITECLVDNDEAFSFDLLMRKLGFYSDAADDINNLDPQALENCQAYAAGFNAYLMDIWPLGAGKYIPFKPRPWGVKDTLAVMKLHTYLGLAQIQENAERCVIQAIRDRVDIKKLKALFSPHLDALDQPLMDLIGQCAFVSPFLQKGRRFLSHVAPALLSSNNWALAPSKTESHGAHLCMDPHLQINRLPSIWYEVLIHDEEHSLTGITTPGIPEVIMGRTQHLSAGFTYGQMDQIDFFIEEIKNGATKRGSSWVPLHKREEVIHRKKKGDVSVTVFESDAGIVETNQDGLCFSMGWANQKRGASDSLNALSRLWGINDAKETLDLLPKVTLSSNWICADTKGNIAFVQAGRLPNRKQSGLFPLPAWEEKNLWDGFVDPKALATSLNPKEGFLISANDDKNTKNGPLTINLPIASYRHDRIKEVLQSKKTLSIKEQKELQCDLFSLQAKAFMEKLFPLIPDGKAGRILKQWDLRYAKESKGATLFEAVYKELLKAVFATPLFGESSWDEMINEKPFFAFLYGQFDTILLTGDESLWFRPLSRIEVFQKALDSVFARYKNQPIPPYGETRQFTFANILIDERFPKFLGFDFGPVPLEGSRATISQGQIFYEKGRKIATGPSWRFISDLSQATAYTSLPGGPSENRLSRHYTSELKNWQRGHYKTLFLSTSDTP